METSLLSTKLLIPPVRTGLVPRCRLMERMQATINYRLVLVAAPAGFGKTTLASQWAWQSRDQIGISWLGLDEGDNDPVRFWDYFVASLRTLHPNAGDAALGLLHSPDTYSIESVLTALINSLAGIPGDFAVVLDDYHLVTAGPVHAGVSFLLDHLPPNMHLVLTTRADPPLPLARYRGRGMMLEIGTDDLRFTLDEAAALLDEAEGSELGTEGVSAVNARTEGWAVGLKMAALSLRGRRDIDSFLASFTGSQRYVMDYLVEEVLLRQTEDVQTFLLKTSVLERLTASLCDFVTESSDSRDMLAKLDSDSGGFLVPLDESREWYRYHNLLADLLRHQAAAKYGMKEADLLHQRASQWYENNNFTYDAVRHALDAKDWRRAAALIGKVAESLAYQGQMVTLLNWLQSMPVDVLRTYARLHSRYVHVLIDIGQADAAEAVLSDFEREAGEDAGLQGEAALYRAMLANRAGNAPRTVEMAKRALELLPPANLAMRANASYILGVMEMSAGNLQEARSRQTDAREMARRGGDHSVLARSTAHLGHILWLQGKLSEALETQRRAIELAGRSPTASLPLSRLSVVLYERNDLEAAAESAKLAASLSELGGRARDTIMYYYLVAQTMLAEGNVAAAETAMKRSDQAALHPAVLPGGRAGHAAFRVLFAIRQDDPAAILTWSNQLAEYAAALVGFMHQAAPARVMIALGKKQAAAQLLEDLYKKATQAEANGLIIKIRLYQALAADMPAEALSFLAEALNMGQPESFIRSFVDEGRLLKPLLRTAFLEGITSEYTAKLLNIIEAEERQGQTGNGIGPSRRPSGILRERELEVLRLLASGLSNRQVAEGLVITLGTTKTHVHSILEKLNARTRTQAIARARELKLI